MNGAKSALRHASRMNGTAQMMSRRCAFRKKRTEHPNELYTSSNLLFNADQSSAKVSRCAPVYASPRKSTCPSMEA